MKDGCVRGASPLFSFVPTCSMLMLVSNVLLIRPTFVTIDRFLLLTSVLVCGVLAFLFLSPHLRSRSSNSPPLHLLHIQIFSHCTLGSYTPTQSIKPLFFSASSRVFRRESVHFTATTSYALLRPFFLSSFFIADSSSRTLFRLVTPFSRSSSAVPQLFLSSTPPLSLHRSSFTPSTTTPYPSTESPLLDFDERKTHLYPESPLIAIFSGLLASSSASPRLVSKQLTCTRFLHLLRPHQPDAFVSGRSDGEDHSAWASSVNVLEHSSRSCVSNFMLLLSPFALVISTTMTHRQASVVTVLRRRLSSPAFVRSSICPLDRFGNEERKDGRRRVAPSITRQEHSSSARRIPVALQLGRDDGRAEPWRKLIFAIAQTRSSRRG